jgi:hypothetical protein
MVSSDSRDQDGGKKGTRGETEHKGVDVEAPRSGFGPNGCDGGMLPKNSKGKICDASIEDSGGGREPLRRDESVV